MPFIKSDLNLIGRKKGRKSGLVQCNKKSNLQKSGRAFGCVLCMLKGGWLMRLGSECPCAVHDKDLKRSPKEDQI